MTKARATVVKPAAKKPAKKVATKAATKVLAAKSSKRSRPSTALYRAHPGVAMLIKWREELKGKSGRSLEEWCAFLDKSCKGKDAKARTAFLKSEHGMGSNTASWLADRSVGDMNPWDSTNEGYLARCPELVDTQFEGGKAHLRSIADALLDLCRSLGSDVGISPCETIIPAYRNHVIAQVSVPNRNAVHFGLALKGEKFTARLRDTGGTEKKNRITHRFEIASRDDIDAVVRSALARAYELDA